MCNFLRSSNPPVFSKREIIIDFNKHEGQIYYPNTQNRMVNFFQEVIPIMIVDDLHYNLFH